MFVAVSLNLVFTSIAVFLLLKVNCLWHDWRADNGASRQSRLPECLDWGHNARGMGYLPDKKAFFRH